MRAFIIENKERDSNMELLRIISIFFILLLHANFKSIHAPTIEEAHYEPVFSFLRILMEFLCIVGVNVFVLISGWYGIKPKINRFLELIFQVLFFSLLLYLLFIIIESSPQLTSIEFYNLVTLSNYWFVPCYIILYVLSPIINMYINHANRKQLCYTIVCIFFLQIIYGWFPSRVAFFYSSGYSPITFILLYLIGRYVSLYRPKFSMLSQKRDLFFYLLFSLGSTFLLFLSIKCSIFMSLSSILLYYTSPLVIVASLYLLLFFSKITFRSKIVNWIAASAFAAYLFQEHYLFVDVYTSYIYRWFDTEKHLLFLLYTICWILIVFIMALILDKIRIVIWKKISYKLLKRFCSNS